MCVWCVGVFCVEFCVVLCCVCVLCSVVSVCSVWYGSVCVVCLVCCVFCVVLVFLPVLSFAFLRLFQLYQFVFVHFFDATLVVGALFYFHFSILNVRRLSFSPRLGPRRPPRSRQLLTKIHNLFPVVRGPVPSYSVVSSLLYLRTECTNLGTQSARCV